jgi:hypothetical protein
MTINIFESASKTQLRFQSNKGLLSTEDLWNLPLTSKSNFDLDTLAKYVFAELKATEEGSFVSVKTNPAKAVLELKLEILKHIIAVKIQDAANASAMSSRKQEHDKLLGLLERKQDQALGELTEAEILAKIAALNN